MKGVKEITRRGAKFVDGLEIEFDSIILATGYKSNVPSWLKVRTLNKKVVLTISNYHFLPPVVPEPANQSRCREFQSFFLISFDRLMDNV